MTNVEEMEFVDKQDHAAENLYDQFDDDNDQTDQDNAEVDGDLDEDDDIDDDDDEEDEDEYGTAWCPYCDAKIDYFGCSHVVYDFDATNCKFQNIDNDLMELMVYLILDKLSDYTYDIEFPEIETDENSDEEEIDIIQKLLEQRKKTEVLDELIDSIKDYILELRYQEFEDILDSFHFQNSEDYCMIEILDTDNRSYCDGRVFGMAKNSKVFEPGLAPLREKYGWLEVV